MKNLSSPFAVVANGSPPPNCFTILVIDDLPENREMFARILGRAGYRIQTAVSGSEALQSIVRQPRPDLVITDVEMPGLSGVETVRQIRRLPAGLSSLPVIAASGNPDTAIKRDMIAAGADAFLAKPVDIGELLETVAEFLRRRTPPAAHRVEQQLVTSAA